MKHIATVPPAYRSRRRGGRRFAMDYHRGDTLVAQRTYAYDQLGRPTARTITRQGSTRTDAYTYNNRSELISDVVDGTGLNGWDYDNIGNRLLQQQGSACDTYTSNQLNQYTAIEDEAHDVFTPTYDDDGNQTRIKTSTGIWNVAYNAKNRPVLFTRDDNSVSVECTYDYMGRRATKKVTQNGTVTLHQRYLYRGYLQIACCDLLRSNEPCLWLITWDPTQPIATRPQAIQKDGTWYTYGLDLTKNVWEVYGTTGYIGTAYTYTAYGQVTASGSITQPIQWSSEYNDTELGLVYYNYRYYSPLDGRWSSRDSYMVLGDPMLYLYATNCPVKLFDFIGFVEFCCPESISVKYTKIHKQIKLIEDDSSLMKSWIKKYIKEQLPDIQDAALNNQGNNDKKFPYGILHTDFSEDEVVSMFKEYHSQVPTPILRNIRKRGTKPDENRYYGDVFLGKMILNMPKDKCCKKIELDIQSGGRADHYSGGESNTAAGPTSPDKKGWVFTTPKNIGTIAGFYLANNKNNKALGNWWGNRTSILIHLAPLAGLDGVRQFGSHGCISTRDEKQWSDFKKAMMKCSSGTYIPLSIENNTGHDYNS